MSERGREGGERERECVCVCACVCVRSKKRKRGLSEEDTHSSETWSRKEVNEIRRDTYMVVVRPSQNSRTRILNNDSSPALEGRAGRHAELP